MLDGWRWRENGYVNPYREDLKDIIHNVRPVGTPLNRMTLEEAQNLKNRTYRQLVDNMRLAK